MNIVVTDDQINDLIEAFQTAPCGMHQADVMNLVVVKDEGLRQEIENATDNSCYNTPILFVIKVCLVKEMHQLLLRISC